MVNRIQIIVVLVLLLSSCNFPRPISPGVSRATADPVSTLYHAGERGQMITTTSQPYATAATGISTVQSTATGLIVFACQVTRLSHQNQLCLVQADGSGWRQLTDDLISDHFYPSFAPDNLSVVFSSNRSGEYQIHEILLDGGQQRQLTDSGSVYAPAVSPDGSMIVYTYNPGTALADSQLWLMQRDGSGRYPLTSMPGGAWDASWSPDGEHILFASQVGEKVQLFIIQANGAAPQQLTDLTGLRGRNDWAPDGLLATYIGTAWQREIITFDQQGQNLVYVTQGGNNLAPSFSPDGEWIVYTSYQDNYLDDHGCEIYIMRRDGSDKRRLTENDYCDWQPRWSR